MHAEDSGQKGFLVIIQGAGCAYLDRRMIPD